MEGESFRQIVYPHDEQFISIRIVMYTNANYLSKIELFDFSSRLNWTFLATTDFFISNSPKFSHLQYSLDWHDLIIRDILPGLHTVTIYRYSKNLQ